MLLLCILVSIVYANSFGGAWIFDDEPNIVKNAHVHMKTLDWESIKGAAGGPDGKCFDRPLSYLSFGINYFFHGLNTRGYHLVNVVIHCLAAAFLYLFIFQTLNLTKLKEKYADRAGSVALLSAALWATSPIHVTSVTYIVQRMASMAALFFIMAMFFYLMGRINTGVKRKTAWFVLCALSGFLSIASKENAVMLPVVLFLFDLLLIQPSEFLKSRHFLRIAGIVMLFLAVMVFALTNPLTILSGYASREFTLVERLLTQPRVLVYYLSLILYPVTDRFTLIYDVPLSTSLFSPWTTLPAILFWMLWLGLGIFWVKKKPLVSFCLLFFVINHLIESSIIPLELVYEHRNYLPSMALFFLVGMGLIALLRDVCKKRLLKFMIAAFICVIFAEQGFSVMQRNVLFKDPLHLWHDNAIKAPGLSRVYTNLGRVYSDIGMFEAAEKSYLLSIEAGRYHQLKLQAVPLHNLGNCYLQKGEIDKAIQYYEKALSVDQSYSNCRLHLANALILIGDIDRAKTEIEKLPDNTLEKATVRILNSVISLKQGNYRLAIRHAHQAMAMDAELSSARKIIGEAHMRIGNYTLARRYWLQCRNNFPQDMETLLALIHLAHVTKDRILLRQSAVDLLSLKKNRSWEEIIKDYSALSKTNIVVFSSEPEEILPLVRKGLEVEITELPKTAVKGNAFPCLPQGLVR